MATSSLIPVSEYLSTIYDPDCDYVDGEIQERNLGEQDHSDLQMRIADTIISTAERRHYSGSIRNSAFR